MTTSTTRAGQRCLTVTAGDLDLDIAVDVGPRILGFSTGGANVLAELPDTVIEATGVPPYRCWGGHRLWVAPEIPNVTYESEDAPVAIARRHDGVEITRHAESAHGVGKSLLVALDREGARIEHRVTNTSTAGIRIAPWAITQFPLEGLAVVSIGTTPSSAHQASRSIVLWPYTRLADSRLALDDMFIAVTAEQGEPLKVGAAGHGGWLGYLRDDLLFVKQFEERFTAPYADLGATAQIYSGPEFLELETLGELRVLGPGEHAEHAERWSLHEVSPDLTPGEVVEFVEDAVLP